jgi:hypothetical protein
LQVEVRNGGPVLGSTDDLQTKMSRTKDVNPNHRDPRIRYWVRAAGNLLLPPLAAPPQLSFLVQVHDWPRIARAVNMPAAGAPSSACQSSLTYLGVTATGRPKFQLQVSNPSLWPM